jgi:ribosomal protein L35AE/L33A
VHAVVVKVTVNDREAAEKRLREVTIPRVSQLAGVVAGYWTRSDGPDGVSMVVFESEDAARAAADQVPQMVTDAVTLESVEVREVVANV